MVSRRQRIQSTQHQRSASRNCPMKTVTGTVKNGKIELPQPEQLPEGTQVTVIIDEPDSNFWQNTSHNSQAKNLG